MKLEQRQELKLALAPVLIQRLDLLILPQLELQQLIKQELEQNPFLEKEEQEGELPLPEEIDDWDSYPKSVEYKAEDEKKLPIPSPKPTLKENLLSQLRTTIKDPRLVEIGEHIIYELNEDGYLPVSVEEIADFFDEEPKKVECVLKEIQKFEPNGVGARDLQECLLIQLQYNPDVPKDAISIVKNFLKDFLAQNYEKIKDKLKDSGINIEKTLQFIKSCRPKPGRAYTGDVKYVLPEIVIEKQGDEWVASLIDEWIPKLRLAKPYREMLKDLSSISKDEQSYLRKKWQDARLLIKGIEKRRETLTDIANYITKNLSDYLNHKSNSLKFFTLQEVAQGIGRDPSTVSRAIKEKWIQTPRGAFKLKSFFSGGKIKEYSEIVSRIKWLVENEDKSTPLMDQKIAEILRKEGFNIARTTVIKYRNQLGILTASKRKAV